MKQVVVIDTYPDSAEVSAVLLRLSGFQASFHREPIKALMGLLDDPAHVCCILISGTVCASRIGKTIVRQAHQRRIPVIAMSTPPYKKFCRLPGVTGILTKPFDPEALVSLISRLCVAEQRPNEHWD